MILPFFIALAIASSELWGRRIRYLKHNEEDSIEDCISGLSDGMGRQVGPELLNVEDGDKQDCISGLSDDILSLILSHLSFRDAVKTNKLSRRWRYLHASVPKLDFNSLTMFSQSKGDCMCPYYLKKSVKVVNQFIQLYSGLKIFSFGFAFCFGKMFAADIERWITFAIRMGVEELDINFKCNEYLSCVSYKYNYSELRTFSCQLLSEASKLQRLHLHGCILTPSFNVKINSLKCLDLDGVPLAGREVEDILSCCLNLEQLRMRKCILPTKLCVHGPFLRLKNLTINFCLGLKEIDLCASNLNFFECFDHELIKFSFSRVPNLERVFIHMNRAIGMPYIFNELPKDLPQLKTLLVRTATIHVSFIPETITWFSSIRQLELILTTGQSIDLVKITCILSACPLLQKFCLVTTSSSCHSYYKRRKEPPLCHHTQLEEVEFGGFEGSRNELNLALYFLRSAAALRRMFISTKFRFYCGFGNWENKCFHAWNEKEREMIRRHFQGKALSGNAEVIVT